MSEAYRKYNERYHNGGCTKEQLLELVNLGILTEEEYVAIVGEDE